MREIFARIVIDSTDDADAAAAAGAPYHVGREESGIDKAMQPATLIFHLSGIDWDKVYDYIQIHDKPLKGGFKGNYLWGYPSIIKKYRSENPRIAAYDLNIGKDPDGAAWINSVQIFGVDGTSPESRREAYATARTEIPLFVDFLNHHAPGFKHAALVEVAPELYIRETRHLIGLYVLSGEDIRKEKMFWDKIAVASYPIDVHPYEKGEMNPIRAQRRVYTIPLRSLIPRRVGNLFVAGRSFSATYQAAGSARIVPTTMAMGQAAGVAASECVEKHLSPGLLVKKEILVYRIEERLRKMGAQLSPWEP